MKRPGYILVVTLLILTLAIVITTNIFNIGTVHSAYSRTVTDREKARTLAQSGIQLAMSQLTARPTKEQQVAEQKDLSFEKKLFLLQVLPGLNRLQRFPLKESIDGIDAEIGFCISSEDGKLNINTLYDFENKKFIGEGQPQGDMKKIMQLIFKQIEKDVDAKNLFESFERYLKERGKPLDDVTELLHQKEFSTLKHYLFYEPPSVEDKKDKKKRPWHLNDLFTVSTTADKLQPWLLSDSWCKVLGLRRAETGDIKDRKDAIKNAVKVFKTKASWQEDWDTALKSLYGKNFSGLSKDIVPLLSTQFESNVFSVLSYGKVGNITQRAYAILEKRIKQEKGSESPFIIKKLYWI